jgi:hypothetical protein
MAVLLLSTRAMPMLHVLILQPLSLGQHVLVTVASQGMALGQQDVLVSGFMHRASAERLGHRSCPNSLAFKHAIWASQIMFSKVRCK